MTEFMFATGIECSYPTIDGGRWRVDELESTGHYKYWRRDLELVRELGLRYLRYGPPLYRVFKGPDKYDWSFMDGVAKAMQELEIVPIVDLCHFGLPDWLENFQNSEFPEHLAEYARAFANRYPWMQFYTPINEMYVTARLSALDGLWNEQLKSDKAFVKATCNVAKASVLMMQAITRECPKAIFINSESSEFHQACCPDPEIRRIADFENQRRFIALDLLYGVPVRSDVYAYLIDNGMSREDYDWFMKQDVAGRAILGVDYYEWNEKLINSDGKPENLGELFGWYVITKQYYDRYKRPVMHTETNCVDANEAPGWLWRQWHNVQLIRQNGVPVVGFTWYSLQDQVDWNVGLTRSLGDVFPVGLFDLNRDPRPVAQAYKHLVEMFRDEPLLTGSELSDAQWVAAA
jgi:beta-glucosidase/6-phospho-beta-glucosidase/beta-galactosidase